MASLDEMEGDLVEVGAIVLFIIIAFFVWEAYSASGNLADAIKSAFKKIGNFFNNLFANDSATIVPTWDPTQGSSPYDVITGTNVGNMGDGYMSDGTSVNDYMNTPQPVSGS